MSAGPAGPAARPEPGGDRDLTHGAGDWAGLRVLVAGIDRAGFAAADALLERGAEVLVLDPGGGEAEHEREVILSTLGATVRLGDDGGGDGVPPVAGALPDLLVVTPAWAPDHPLVTAARAAGTPSWGEPELAWRMRAATGAAPWLTLTGTSGRSTTAGMLEAMLSAAGLRAAAVGGDDAPVLESVLHPRPYDVLAVELSARELHRIHSPSPRASACLNVAPDHLGWHGSADAQAADLGRVYAETIVACVYNVADPATEQLVRDADVVEGCRAVGFTLGVPAVSMLGLVEDVLCDRAFVAERRTSAAELGSLEDVRGAVGGALAPHHVADALAAAALARAHGVPPAAVRDGLRGTRPGPHRSAEVAVVGGVTWVDDAAATNPHAASASLAGHDRVVWVAGGTAGGATFDDLAAAHAGRLRAAVLVGPDRGLIAEALARHAPGIPVVVVDLGETDRVQLMTSVVDRARGLARPGDTVLLAPGCGASPAGGAVHPGDAFAAAVRALPAAGPQAG